MGQTVEEGYVPLSARLYRQQQKLERELHDLAHPPEAGRNPFHILDPACWGEQNFWIEDRYDLGTGNIIGPGLIALAPHQRRIIRAALARTLDIQDHIQDVKYVQKGPEHIQDVKYVPPLEHVVNMTLSSTPTGGGEEGGQPAHLGGTNVREGGDEDGVMYIYTILLYITPSSSPSSFSYSNSGIGIPESLCQVMPTQAQAQATLEFLVASSLTPSTAQRVIVEIDQVPQYCQSLPYYAHVQAIMQELLKNTNPIAALEQMFVTSTRFKYSTIVYSCPKKSGKTRIAAMVASWLASYSLPYSEIYCLANDGKQSSDRVLRAIHRGVTLAKGGKSRGGKSGSVMRRWEQVKLKVELPGGQFIEAIPVDPEGEAGSQPTGTFFSELWGYGAAIKAKEKLWTELTIPPTRWGRAIRWVESYAGNEGESMILWNLYLQGVDEKEHPQGKAVRHSDFPELPVYTNERANLFCYWDHEPRMVWQVPEYYQAEAAALPESEFRRVHRNEWVAPLEQAIPIDRWDQLMEKLPTVGKDEPIVLGVDLSVSGDYSALVVVSKHPDKKSNRTVAIRGVYIWEPQAGQKIDYLTTIMPAIRRLVRNKDGSMNYNVICITYDEYQAHLMSVELTNELGVWWSQFSQGKGTPQHPGRPVADKMLFDLVMSGQLSHDGNVVLRQHVHNAAAKTTDEGRYMRFVKKRPDAKIDALVAASMAVCMISTLNV